MWGLHQVGNARFWVRGLAERKIVVDTGMVLKEVAGWLALQKGKLNWPMSI